MEIKDCLKDALPIIKRFAPTVGKAIEESNDLRAEYLILVICDKFKTPPFNPFSIKVLVDNMVSDWWLSSKLKSIEEDCKDFALEILRDNNLTSDQRD